MTNVTALQTATTQDQPQRINASALMMNPESMDRIMRMAEMMASGKSTVPVHLQKNPADCMAVVLQAMSWGMLPHIVAQKTHIVNGTLGYEAQLVNAVVQESGCITGRFHYEYKGNSPGMECRVGAILRGEREITWGEWLNESKVTTKNSPLWKTNPKQQMGYLQVKNWARLYAPGAILGVYTPDEFDAPQPRNMGSVQEVGAPDPLPAGILESAQSAAEEGVASYSAFWKSASPETRKAIGKDEHNRLKEVATNADQHRTVDSGHGQAAKRVLKTFEQVMAALVAAQSIDALYVAGEFIGDIADMNESNILAGKFDELKAEMEGA